ncbi:MAG: DUF2752 domain-containing protein [Eubacterium sp.]|nr:DUF2752 domain-containing protein [Eubacterium sp.]
MTETQRFKRIIVFIGVACLLGGGYAILCMQGIMIPCVFFEVTGLRCPGCGVTHMMLSLIQLDFDGAFHANQALFILLPFFVFFGIKITIRYIRTGSLRLTNAEKIICFIVIVLLLIFAILRNLLAF